MTLRKRQLLFFLSASALIQTSVAASQSSRESTHKTEKKPKTTESKNEAQSTAILPLKESAKDVGSRHGALCMEIANTGFFFGIGGFIKCSGFLDLYGRSGYIGESYTKGRYFLATYNINAEDSQRFSPRFYISARESRLMLMAVKPINAKDLKFQFAMDFLGDGSGNPVVSNAFNFRLVQAYVQYGSWLIGQDFSTFTDMSTYPQTLCLNGPTGNSQVRQAMVRYTHSWGNGISLAVAIENPETEFSLYNGQGGYASSIKAIENGAERYKARNNMPDCIVRFFYTTPQGSFSIRGILKNNTVGRFDADMKPQKTFCKLAYGFDASGSIKIRNAIHFVGQFGIGTGIGRYFTDILQITTVKPHDKDQLVNNWLLHASVGTMWHMTQRLSSTIAYGCAKLLTQNGLDTSLPSVKKLNHFTQSVHCNIIYKALENVDIGIEYVFGYRQNIEKKPFYLHRIMFAVKAYIK